MNISTQVFVKLFNSYFVVTSWPSSQTIFADKWTCLKVPCRLPRQFRITCHLHTKIAGSIGFHSISNRLILPKQRAGHLAYTQELCIGARQPDELPWKFFFFCTFSAQSKGNRRCLQAVQACFALHFIIEVQFKRIIGLQVDILFTKVYIRIVNLVCFEMLLIAVICGCFVSRLSLVPILEWISLILVIEKQFDL